jgi:hypothetical protein
MISTQYVVLVCFKQDMFCTLPLSLALPTLKFCLSPPLFSRLPRSLQYKGGDDVDEWGHL